MELLTKKLQTMEHDSLFLLGNPPSLVTEDGNILVINKLYTRGCPLLSHWIVLSMRIWSKPIIIVCMFKHLGYASNFNIKGKNISV